jgi:heat shock protein HslJ
VAAVAYQQSDDSALALVGTNQQFRQELGSGLTGTLASFAVKFKLSNNASNAGSWIMRLDAFSNNTYSGASTLVCGREDDETIAPFDSIDDTFESDCSSFGLNFDPSKYYRILVSPLSGNTQLFVYGTTSTNTGWPQVQNAGGAIAGLGAAFFQIKDKLPSVDITDSPTDLSNATTTVLNFQSSAGSFTQCQLAPVDPQFLPCNATVTYHNLSSGSYVFTVEAVNDFGTTTASTTFVIDTVPPTVSITSGPTNQTINGQATFGFSAEAGASTTCAFDADAAAPCSAYATSSALADGVHTFTVVATDTAGNSANATAHFTLDNTAPTLTEVTPVPTPTTNNTPSYTFNTNEMGVIIYGGSCNSSTGSATLGNNTVTFAYLVPGAYNDCTIRVTDAAGNTSNPLAISPFTVDNPPVTTGGLVINVSTSGGDKTITLTGDNGLGNFTVTTVGGIGTESFENIPAGTYHITTSVPTGWTLTNNECATVTVAANDTAVCGVALTKNGTTNTKSAIIGLVFNDKDGDGKLDLKKKEITLLGNTGWKVYLDLNNNGVLDSNEPTNTTIFFGIYYFKNLTPGTYVVRLAPKAGYHTTAPASGYKSVTTYAGHLKIGAIFGVKAN